MDKNSVFLPQLKLGKQEHFCQVKRNAVYISQFHNDIDIDTMKYNKSNVCSGMLEYGKCYTNPINHVWHE